MEENCNRMIENQKQAKIVVGKLVLEINNFKGVNLHLTRCPIPVANYLIKTNNDK